MKKLLILATFACVGAPCSHVEAQTVAPNTSPQTPTPARTVTIVGAVEKSGVYPFIEGEKAAELLKRAGGAGAVAAFSEVYVLRDGWRILLDLSQDNIKNLTLRESDILVVPEELRRIFVIGGVAIPEFSLCQNKSKFPLSTR